MAPGLILLCIVGYFVFLLGIAWYTARDATNASYFLGNRASPWYAVAFGLIGDSLSGVTFISVPGRVGVENFSYLQLVYGYVLGYVMITTVLLPLYYRLNLTSIYSYLLARFGPMSQKTGSVFFLVSRTMGAAARLYLAASVIQFFLFDEWGIPFWLVVLTAIVLMLFYTYKGGIRTLVWTDTFQSAFLLLGVLLSILAISMQLDWGLGDMVRKVWHSDLSRTFFWDWRERNYFWKQFLGGAAVAVAMTGLDQNMMQKNLSCRSLGEAQKNIYSFTGVMVLVNVLFLSLGVLLYEFAAARSIAVPGSTDQLFPLLALHHLGTFAGIMFIFGLTAATFSSADSVLTTLTTSFCIDILGTEREGRFTDRQQTRLRHQVHILFAVVLLLVILGFKALNQTAVINAVLVVASYTYGPLLGLFAFGLFARSAVRDRWVPVVCLAAPAFCFILDQTPARWLGGYQFGQELLIVNGLLTFLGLCVIRHRQGPDARVSRAK